MNAVLLWLALGAAPSATLRCLADSERAQQLREEGALLIARETLSRCVSMECPAVVRADCARWSEEIRHTMPSIIVVANEAGEDLSDAKVWVDGRLALEHLTGQPIEVDPGGHTVRVRLGSGAVLEKKVLVPLGEKNRTVRFAFQQPARPEVLRVSEARRQPSAWVPLLLTAGAVAGGVTFGVLGGTGSAELRRLQADACAATRTCDPVQVGRIRGTLIAGDVALLSGSLLAALATWRWIAFATDVPPTVALGLTLGGPALSVSGRF